MRYWTAPLNSGTIPRPVPAIEMHETLNRGVKITNPSFSTETESEGWVGELGPPQTHSRTASVENGASARDWMVLPDAVAKEPALENELENLFELLRSMAEYLEAQTSEDPGFSTGEKFEAGIPRDKFCVTMRHMGVVISEAESMDMFLAADAAGSRQQRDATLQMDEFIEMTADAQRDIHDDDHVRSPSLLWRMVYERLRLLQDARLMRRKVFGLRTLFGLSEDFGTVDEDEGVQAAAQLVFDVVTNRNIYHRLNDVGRTSYLRLHRLRYLFATAVWLHLWVGWVEDNAKPDHDWFSDLHIDGHLYWAVPAVELLLLTPIHLFHCYLRKESSVHWKGDKWLLGKLACTFFIVCDAAHECVGGRNTAPFSRLARPYLLLDLYSSVRSLHQQCFAALASLKELMWLALVFLFFFVLAGMMMFPSPSNSVEVDDDGNVHGIRGTSQGAVVFTDLWMRLANLVYLTFGAVNYPDIMLPSYIEDGGPALAYFIPAIVVFLFLFLNIVLAVVYNGYTGDRDENMVKSTAKRCVALTIAFRGIARETTEIDRQTFVKFVKAYRQIENNFENDYVYFGDSNEPRPEELEQLWAELKPQKRGDKVFIGPYEFLQLPALLAGRRFRQGPQWALTEANCELSGVRREDAKMLVKSSEGVDTIRSIEEGDLEDLVGKPVKIDRVRGWVGDEKILTRKLQKHRSVAALSEDVLSSSAPPDSPRPENAKSMSTHTREARKTCWVGKIPKDTSEQTLKDIFEKYGHVLTVTLRNKNLDCNSWAFVKFSRGRDASAAIEGGAKLGSSTLQVEGVNAEYLDRVKHQEAGDMLHQSAAQQMWNEHTNLKLDWSGGVPLVWRRRTDIHESAELVTFTGVVTEKFEVPKDDGTTEISLNIRCDFEQGQARSTWERFKRGGLHPPLRKFLLRRDVNAFIISVILISLVVTFYQYLYRAEHTREQQARWHTVDYCITFFFVSELIAKIVAFGFIGYWKSTWHRVDLFITTATVISTFSLAWTPSRSNVPEHRYWMLFKLMRACRVFRLLRLLSALGSRKDAMDKYHLIFAVTTHAAGAMRDFFYYVIVVFYIYSIIGIDWFGGPNGITQGKPKSCIESFNMPNPVLEGTGFDGASYTSIGLCYDDNRTDNWGDKEQVVSSYYYGMNFDDMGDAFVTLLHMLIMNNWHVTHEACVAVFEDNAKLCIEYGANTTLYSLCDQLHSRWLVSAYFYSFEFYVALVLVNILMSFFLDIYSFMWDKYTEHFRESRHQNAHRNILHMVDTLADVAHHAGIQIDGHRDTNEDQSTGAADAQGNALASRFTMRTKVCAGCLLCEPAVKDIRSSHVPLFVPSYGMYADIAGFDAVKLCEACRRYWSAIEMLTVQHGTISGLDQSIADAMSQDDIAEQRADMELKVRIMLKLKDVSGEGHGDSLGLLVVPIRPGLDN